jgi:hypothetical protein
LIEILLTIAQEKVYEPYTATLSPQWGRGDVELRGEHHNLRMEVPHAAEELKDGPEVSLGYAAIGNITDQRDVRDLLMLSVDISTAFIEATEAARKEAEAEEEKALLEEQKRREEAQEREDERKERLLNEFAGEFGRIRIRGYHRWRPVEVKVEPYVDEDHWPWFYYQNRRHGYREPFYRSIVSFEVKVGSRYFSVWDDGYDDLPEYQQAKIKLPRPVYGEDD